MAGFEAIAQGAPDPFFNHGIRERMRAVSIPSVDLFTNRKPTPEQADVLDEITTYMVATHAAILRLLPHGREKAIAVTKLEEVSMWSKKAVLFSTDPS